MTLNDADGCHTVGYFSKVSKLIMVLICNCFFFILFLRYLFYQVKMGDQFFLAHILSLFPFTQYVKF